MCFALFMIMLDNTVVNVALPSIQKDLHSLDQRPGVDHQRLHAELRRPARHRRAPGRHLRPPARCSSSASSSSASSSAFIGFSQSEAWLVAGRAVQGIGAAFMMPAHALDHHQRLPGRTSAARRSARGPASARWRSPSARWSAASWSRTSPGSRSSSSTCPVAVVRRRRDAVRHARVARRDARRTTSTSPASPTITVGLAALVLALVEGNAWGWGSAAIVGAARRRGRRPGRLRRSSSAASPSRWSTSRSSARARSWAPTSSPSS